MASTNNDTPSEREPCVGYVFTTDIPDFFSKLSLSLFVTTYQAQRVLLFTPGNAGKMNMLMRVFPRPTGMYVDGNVLLLCTKNQIWNFNVVTDIQNTEGEREAYDLCYAPRYSHVTGDILAHQVTVWNQKPLVVNTRFSCLATLDPSWSFVPLWKPPFVSAIVPEDRCHLNGVCLDADGPKYATALGATDKAEGWRDNKASGGVLIDIPSNSIVTAGLSMPHTPVLYRGHLWVLESGTGSLCVVDQKSGKPTTVARFPGFLRGLAFIDRFAFVGLCKAREKKNFGGLPIENEHQELQCAIYILDISTGQTVGFIQFTKGIEELFDIQVLQGPRKPHMLGFEEDTVDGLMVLPPLEQKAQKGTYL